MSAVTGLLQFQQESIRYQVVFSTRRRTLGIEVHPDSQVLVRAPAGCNSELIEARLQQRAGWISKQLTRFRRFSPRTPPRQYVSGETHLYLGRQYRLKIIVGDEPSVKLARGKFMISAPHRIEADRIMAMLSRWYLDHSMEVFSRVLEECFLRFSRRGHELPKLSVRVMKTRWGSLSPSGTMTLNANLIRAPKSCIEYVIFHELCHLEHKDHSAKFYRLLDRMLPDWEQRKQRLEEALL